MVEQNMLVFYDNIMSTFIGYDNNTYIPTPNLLNLFYSSIRVSKTYNNLNSHTIT